MKLLSSSTAIIVAAVAGSASAQTMKVSITQYGAGDSQKSPNCNTATASCQFYNNPGFNAAVSQNIFGSSSGVGPGCRSCYKLTPQTDGSGKPLKGGSPIVVKINNLCPNTPSNPLCNQTETGDHNKVGAEAHFDLCIDDGASGALFGSSGVQMAIGTAEPIGCMDWKGSAELTH